jgi:endonuclease/exonuclease/phosphatase (EEP) superfamily protein YafD
LTASRVQSSYAQAYLSEAEEVFFGPHKSILFTSYIFKDKSKILVLNVHMINFRENGLYNKELGRFFAFLESYEGAMIFAGDFNSWNKKRLAQLFDYTEKLKLKVVSFSKSNNLKTFRGNKLDYIFYKGLELENASVEKVKKLSDHNPLYARFKRL